MKKRLLLVFALGAVATFAAAFGVGCSTPNSADDTPEHNYGEWVIDREASCEEVGRKYHTCTDEGCNNMEWEVIPKTPHKYDIPNRTNAGHSFTCSVCKATTEREPHNFKNGICVACGADEGEDLEFTFELSSDKDYYIITAIKDNNALDIIIPSKYKEKPVKQIGDCAFQNNTLLTSVTIPDSVTSIGNRAFDGCSGLKSIYYTGDMASWCVINTNGAIDNKKIYIGNNKLTEMTSITIPDGVTRIGDYAFSGCSALTSIIIPDSVTIIGYAAFCACSGLTNITLPHGVTHISNMAFGGCNALESIYYKGDIASWCSIGGLWNLDKSKVYIGNQKLTEMTSITIPNGVSFINSDAFYGCCALTSIVIPDSVTSIGDMAFYDCNSLTSINIPDSVTGMGRDVFYGCNELTIIYCEAAEQPNSWISLWKGNCEATVIWGYKGEN